MVDRASRNRLAELIRHLVAGQITNDEFEAAIPESDDTAIREVFYHGAWCLYSDMKEYKLRGVDSVATEDKSIIARWILFLKTDFEYSWPSASFKEQFLKSISLGYFGQSTLDKWNEQGDISYWPFINKASYVEAKHGRGYLGK